MLPDEMLEQELLAAVGLLLIEAVPLRFGAGALTAVELFLLLPASMAKQVCAKVYR